MTSSTRWSIDPLLHANLPSEFFESIFADLSLVLFLYLLTLVLSVTYSITHKLLLKYSENYVALEGSQKQIIVTHHAIEAVVLSVLFPIFSYYMIRTNFQIHEDFDEVKSNLRATFKCVFVPMAMYMFELASRFEKPRSIVVFHHLLACGDDGLLVGIFPTSVMCRTASALTYFICFEALTFIGLFMYRIFPESKLTPKVLLAGMISFGITRPFQLLWIGAAVFESWNDEYTVKWQSIMQLFVT